MMSIAKRNKLICFIAGFLMIAPAFRQLNFDITMIQNHHFGIMLIMGILVFLGWFLLLLALCAQEKKLATISACMLSVFVIASDVFSVIKQFYVDYVVDIIGWILFALCAVFLLTNHSAGMKKVCQYIWIVSAVCLGVSPVLANIVPFVKGLHAIVSPAPFDILMYAVIPVIQVIALFFALLWMFCVSKETKNIELEDGMEEE